MLEPKQVQTDSGDSHDITMRVLPCPYFEGTKPVSVQQGAGMVVTQGTDEQIKASVEFLKWFTQPENNISFAVGSGHLPLTPAAQSQELLARRTAWMPLKKAV